MDALEANRERALLDSERGFVKFDQDLAFIRRDNQKKIDESSVRSRPRLGINCFNTKFFVQDFGRSPHIRATKFHLLNSFAELPQIFGDWARTVRVLARQNIYRGSTWEMEFEFLCVLIGRNLRQAGRSVRFMNL